MNTTSNVTPSNVVAAYYDRMILQEAEPLLPHASLGVMGTIPAGAQNMVVFSRIGAKPTVTTTLVEGVTPAPGTASFSKIEAPAEQIGYWEPTSDMLAMAVGDSYMEAQTVAFGNQAARSIDYRTSLTLSGGTSVLRAGSRATRAEIISTDIATVADMQIVSTTLKNANAVRFPGINRFVALVPPNVAHDLSNDTQIKKQWQEGGNEMSRQAFGASYLGDIHGISFIESTATRVFTGEGAGGIDVYSVMVLAVGFYGWHALQQLAMIFKDQGQGEDPLNQRSTQGWKAAFAAKILFDQYAVRYECASSLG